jgi:drug/metabolite transporter (DMT)-like permease
MKLNQTDKDNVTWACIAVLLYSSTWGFGDMFYSYLEEGAFVVGFVISFFLIIKILGDLDKRNQKQ